MTEAAPEESKLGPVGSLERLPTNCKALDTLTDGGLATGTITQIFGEKALGKSMLSLQAALSAVSNGNSALVLDTEQSYFSYLAPYWVPRLSAKLGQDFQLKHLKLEKVPKRAAAGRGDKKREPASRSQVITSLSNALNQLGITYSESEIASMADMVCPEFQLQLDDVKGPTAMVIQMPDVIELLSLHDVFWGAIFRGKKRPTQVLVNVRYPEQRSGNSIETATTKAPEQAPQTYQENPSQEAARSPGPSTRYIVGAVLLLLSVVALGEGGVYSPLVFAVPGLVLMFWGRISNSAQFSTFRPVRESVLMRNADVPFLWFALAEVKFATRNVAAALASIDERILIANYEKPTVYVLFRGAELNHSRAEAKLLEKMRETQMTVAPLGAFLLPVDSERAVASMSFSTKPVKVDPGALSHSLFTLPYEMLSIRPKDGYVDSLGLYVRKEDRRKAGEIVVPAPRQKPARRPLLWETLRQVERKLRWPEPDAQTAFLGSMFATREETIGERIVDAANPPGAQVLVVKSVGSPQVELTRAQLRAVVRVYASTVG